MLTNKYGDMTPFDMHKLPRRQNPLLMPLVWGASFLMTRQFHLRIEKVNMDGMKPPFLVLSTHQGFFDYYIAPLALFPHRANYVSDMEGFAAFGEGLYRSVGCIGKRRYVPDYSVMWNIYYCLHTLGQSVVVFPESRHSNAGISSGIPDHIGRLVKVLRVPLVLLTVHGSYLANPFWDEEHTRRTPMKARLEGLYTAQKAACLPEEAIQQVIVSKLQYDEYRWQSENSIRITYPKRAEGLHHVLYQCRSCHVSGQMQSREDMLYCGECGCSWKLNEYGKLIQTGASAQSGEIHIPDWYEWQRKQVEEQIQSEEYGLKLSVRVEALPNARGFVPMGEGILLHDSTGFRLCVNGREFYYPAGSRESVQTEFNYRGRGKCIVLSDRSCCYYLYSGESEFQPAQIQFAAEYLYRNARREGKGNQF